MLSWHFKTLRPRHNDRHLPRTFSNSFSVMKIHEFRLRFHYSLFQRIKVTIYQHWFRKRLGTGEAASHYLNQWWLDYRHIIICVTQPWCVNPSRVTLPKLKPSTTTRMTSAFGGMRSATMSRMFGIDIRCIPFLNVKFEGSFHGNCAKIKLAWAAVKVVTIYHNGKNEAIPPRRTEENGGEHHTRKTHTK